MATCRQLVEDLISSYHDLNSDVVSEIEAEPSALEFMRYVAKNRPFVVRKGITHWKALQYWNADYLIKKMKNETIKVAITPYGNADSVIVDTGSGVQYFVKPLEEDEPFNCFLKSVSAQEHGKESNPNVKYGQTQNDNLRGEYESLFQDVEPDIAWARIAFGYKPEAINLWIGNSRSITALHKDNYENIYCQIIGSKQFVLLPPVEASCVNEKLLPSAKYMWKSDDMDEGQLKMVLAGEGEGLTPFATWDPDLPHKNSTSFSALSKPLRVDLGPGDMLYLPAMWYHKVSQKCGSEGICCAVNYWYDMEFSGHFYSSATFIHDVGNAAAK